MAGLDLNADSDALILYLSSCQKVSDSGRVNDAYVMLYQGLKKLLEEGDVDTILRAPWCGKPLKQFLIDEGITKESEYRLKGE